MQHKTRCKHNQILYSLLALNCLKYALQLHYLGYQVVLDLRLSLDKLLQTTHFERQSCRFLCHVHS